MGNVSWHTPTPVPNFTRNYIRGFGAGIGSSGLALASDRLQGFYLAPDYYFDLKIDARFFPASSNVYSLDYVFDASDSWFYAFGVLSTAVIYLGIVFDPNDFSFRVNVLDNVGFDATQVVDLPSPTGYWRPSF